MSIPHDSPSANRPPRLHATTQPSPIATAHDTLRRRFADLIGAAADDVDGPAGHRNESRALVRWDAHAGGLLRAFATLYADHPETASAAQALVEGMATRLHERPAALRALDAAREASPDWFLGSDMLGYCTYVDRFGDDLRGVAARVPYLQRLGVRYLHLLPFLQAREGDNDGGFAVRDYDAVEPALGTMADLEALTVRLRAAGISLCADLVLNHTADDHRWAVAARAGDPRYRDYYHVFAERSIPDAYDKSLREVFPQTAPGNFTDVPGLGRVWTTFYPYQWDLNWSNPEVFTHMALSLLRLANRGVEGFRLDSTAYLWKRPGTDCMNLPEAHLILQALRAVVDIVAPGVLLKAEAIVPTPELPPYFGHEAARECHLAYHSSLMAALWAGLAQQRGEIVARVLDDTPALPGHCGWLGYLRCHDDIGWMVLAAEAAGDDRQAGYDLAAIAAFYAGETAGSYARGQRFQSAGGNHVHGSNGMSAALTGIEAALDAGDAEALARAERRLLLLHAVMLACTGLPTLYMGDEIALGNDTSYLDDPAHAGEGRWLHRPAMDWALADAVVAEAGNRAAGIAVDPDVRTDASTARLACARRVYDSLCALLHARASLPALRGDAPLTVLPSGDATLLCVARGTVAEHQDIAAPAFLGPDFVGLFNFGEHPCPLPTLPSGTWQDVGEARHDAGLRPLPETLPAHGFLWLQRRMDAVARP